jgi:hypothetical protein
MNGVTYDAGALIAAERDERPMWAFHRRALERGWRPVVPAGVIAQAWRGGPQALLSRLLQGCHVEPLDEARARFAGTLCATTNTSDVVDASVVVEAVRHHSGIVTRDLDDLQRLAKVTGVEIEIVWPT